MNNEVNDITTTISRFAEALVNFINMIKDFFAKLGGSTETPEA